jgi:hypothetical protein
MGKSSKIDRRRGPSRLSNGRTSGASIPVADAGHFLISSHLLTHGFRLWGDCHLSVSLGAWCLLRPSHMSLLLITGLFAPGCQWSLCSEGADVPSMFPVARPVLVLMTHQCGIMALTDRPCSRLVGIPLPNWNTI